MRTATASDSGTAVDLRVLDKTPAFMWVTRHDEEKSRERTTVWCNSKFYSFTGADTSQDLSKILADHVHPDDRSIVWEQWERARDAKSSYEGFVRYRREDGEYRWHWFIVTHDGNDEWHGAALDVQTPMLTKGMAPMAGPSTLEAVAAGMRTTWRQNKMIMYVVFFAELFQLIIYLAAR